MSPPSGNHGGSNTPTVAATSFTDMRTPTRANMPFIPPESVVKRSPTIREVVQDPPAVSPQPPIATPNPAPVPEVAEPPAPPAIDTPEVDQPEQAAEPEQPIPTDKEVVEPQPVTPAKPANEGEKSEAAFKAKWLEMIPIVFGKVASLNTTLKNYPVELKDNVVHVLLKNDMQTNDFSIKKNEVLQFLRNNYDEAINDVEAKVDLGFETQKMVLDNRHMLDALKQQNHDFPEFVKILGLQIKG